MSNLELLLKSFFWNMERESLVSDVFVLCCYWLFYLLQPALAICHWHFCIMHVNSSWFQLFYFTYLQLNTVTEALVKCPFERLTWTFLIVIEWFCTCGFSDEQFVLKRVADCAIDLYAMVVVLSRYVFDFKCINLYATFTTAHAKALFKIHNPKWETLTQFVLQTQSLPQILQLVKESCWVTMNEWFKLNWIS